MMEGAERPAPKGRAALIKEALRKTREAQLGVGAAQEAKVQEDPPRPRGRAALLSKMQALTIGRSAAAPLTSASRPPVETPSPAQSVPVKAEEVAVSSEPVNYKGTTGKPIYVTANYIRMSIDKDKGVFEYDLRFEPAVDAKGARIRILQDNMPKLGGVKMFDGGSCLYLPIRLPDERTVFQTPHPIDGTIITMTVTFKKVKRLGECIHLFNVLFKRVMSALQLSRVGRNYFDMKNSKFIPQHKLEVLPGYAIAVDEYEDGLMLCLDAQHRVLRTITVLDHMRDLRRQDHQRFRENVLSSLLGKVVITKYNNKTYIIDDILFEASPTDSFETNRGPVTFVDYYKNQYNLDVTSFDQPLLLNVQKRKVPQSAEEKDMRICLVPEFSYLTGLTDEMRADFKVMKDVAEFTRVSAHQRLNALRMYISNIKNSPAAQQILSEWGVHVQDATIDLQARILSPEVIIFGKGVQHQNDMKAEWSGPMGRNRVVGPVDINNWAIVYTERDAKIAHDFATNMPRFGQTMGCSISEPYMYQIPNDRTPNYIRACDELITPGLQCITFICPTIRADLYTTIKKITCYQKPVGSQVVISRNLMNQKKVRTVTQKIALQINCKLGGSLWALKIPVKTWMICGIDVYHSPGSKKSVGALVTSTNENFTTYYTQVVTQERELCDALGVLFQKSLQKYREKMGTYPTNVIIYRDGVGDGQLSHVKQYELEQFMSVLNSMQLTDTKITLIVVQKRIGTRIVSKDSTGNPPPGTVLDHSITRRYLADFYLVPQSVTQGTVSPTHYIVLHDMANINPDHIQKLTYKMCHLYYNWSGTIRVPAPCQYAHKVAFLVGQHVGQVPKECLNDRLYYL